jgi:hypothetical protein
MGRNTSPGPGQVIAALISHARIEEVMTGRRRDSNIFVKFPMR